MFAQKYYYSMFAMLPILLSLSTCAGKPENTRGDDSTVSAAAKPIEETNSETALASSAVSTGTSVEASPVSTVVNTNPEAKETQAQEEKRVPERAGAVVAVEATVGTVQSSANNSELPTSENAKVANKPIATPTLAELEKDDAETKSAPEEKVKKAEVSVKKIENREAVSDSSVAADNNNMPAQQPQNQVEKSIGASAKKELGPEEKSAAKVQAKHTEKSKKAAKKKSVAKKVKPKESRILTTENSKVNREVASDVTAQVSVQAPEENSVPVKAISIIVPPIEEKADRVMMPTVGAQMEPKSEQVTTFAENKNNAEITAVNLGDEPNNLNNAGRNIAQEKSSPNLLDNRGSEEKNGVNSAEAKVPEAKTIDNADNFDPDFSDSVVDNSLKEIKKAPLLASDKKVAKAKKNKFKPLFPIAMGVALLMGILGFGIYSGRIKLPKKLAKLRLNNNFKPLTFSLFKNKTTTQKIKIAQAPLKDEKKKAG